MTRHVTMKASHPRTAPRIANYYTRNLSPFVFPRSREDLVRAANHATLIHLETAHRQIVGVCGIFESQDDIHDVGGVLITENGFQLQIPMMQTAAVTLHLTREHYTAITSTVFASNLTSIRNMKKAGFLPWRAAPRDLVKSKEQKAQGESFHIFHAPVSSLIRMARELVDLVRDPVINRPGRSSLVLDLAHPLFTVWRTTLIEFAATEGVADEDVPEK